MSVIVDMILAVTVVAVASGAIAEFQFRIGYICASAYSAPMGVIGMFLCRGLGRKWNGGRFSHGGFLPDAMSDEGEEI